MELIETSINDILNLRCFRLFTFELNQNKYMQIFINFSNRLKISIFLINSDLNVELKLNMELIKVF